MFSSRAKSGFDIQETIIYKDTHAQRPRQLRCPGPSSSYLSLLGAESLRKNKAGTCEKSLILSHMFVWNECGQSPGQIFHRLLMYWKVCYSLLPGFPFQRVSPVPAAVRGANAQRTGCCQVGLCFNSRHFSAGFEQAYVRNKRSK